MLAAAMHFRSLPPLTTAARPTRATAAAPPAAEGYSAAIQRCSPQQAHLAGALGELLAGVQEELKLHDGYALVSREGVRGAIVAF
jgi:hypothetical protein